MSDETKCPTCEGSGAIRDGESGRVLTWCDACNGSGKAPSEPTPSGESAGSATTPLHLPLHVDGQSAIRAVLYRIIDARGVVIAYGRDGDDADSIVSAVNASQRSEIPRLTDTWEWGPGRVGELRRKLGIARGCLMACQSDFNDRPTEAELERALKETADPCAEPSAPVVDGGIARERVEKLAQDFENGASNLDDEGRTYREAARMVRRLLAAPPAAEPVATGEGEAWSVLRELVPLLYYNTSPEYVEAVKRARDLLAKVDGGGK